MRMCARRAALSTEIRRLRGEAAARPLPLGYSRRWKQRQGFEAESKHYLQTQDVLSLPMFPKTRKVYLEAVTQDVADGPCDAEMSVGVTHRLHPPSQKQPRRGMELNQQNPCQLRLKRAEKTAYNEGRLLDFLEPTGLDHRMIGL